ncbi:MAG TPA: alpha/beta fold hydrolase [Polyangiaceae bacterium]|jgi:hypothetical protein|nr:alpha/beta fold hydrolase [Polyangiaceae bacterium]
MGAALALSACHAEPPRSAAPTQAAATSEAIEEREARALLGALAADSAEAAEANFDQRMRTVLPVPTLSAVWQGLEVQYGKLASWQIVTRDHPLDKDRLTIELVFSRGGMRGLVVFEPSSHEVAGLFFLKEPGDTRQADNSDPGVREESLNVGPLALPAIFALPSAAHAPVPAALLVAGSGPCDRDETIGEAKPFHDLAHALAKRGIATLRYDKRTFAHPESFHDPAQITIEAEVLSDAVAALQTLRARAEVDPKQLFVIGHSLGALLTPEIAQRGGGVAGLVLLAPPGRPMEQSLLEQLQSAPRSPKLRDLERQLQTLPTLPANEMVFGAPAEYWRDLDRRDEFAVAVALGRPVLVLRGSLDLNVAAIDQEHWQSALSGRVPIKSATLPGLDHLFLPVSGTEQPKHVAPEVGEMIADFIAPQAAAH